MQRHELGLIVLLATFAVADAAAQPPGGPAPQQAPTATFGFAQPPAPQPIYIVPAPQQPLPNAPRVNPELPTVELAPLLQRLERSTDKQFVVDARIGPQVYLAGVAANDVTYPLLLSI